MSIGILYMVRRWPVVRLTVPFVYSMSDECVKAARNQKVQTQRVNHVARDTDSEVEGCGSPLMA